MPRAIISDASCFILLAKIRALDLLEKTYGKVTTTPVVATEVRFPLPTWVEIRTAKFNDVAAELARFIDPGEASAIALALELTGSTVILDDLKARKIAKARGLEVTGTLGVLLRAKADRVIPLIKPYIVAIRQTSFRLSEKLEDEVLSLAGESES